jgi:hypothetical protein
MAVTSILTTEAEITAKEGANVSTALTDAMHDAWVLQAENFVNTATRRNWSDDFAGLNVDVKYILSDIVSSLVAIRGIMYDMSGYTSRAEAEDMVTELRDGILRNLSILREKKSETFIDGET